MQALNEPQVGRVNARRKAAQLPQWLQPFMVDRGDADSAALLVQEHFRALAHRRPTQPGVGGQIKREPELKDEKEELKDEIKEEVKDEIKEEVKQEIKEEVKQEIKEEVTEDDAAADVAQPVYGLQLDLRDAGPLAVSHSIPRSQLAALDGKKSARPDAQLFQVPLVSATRGACLDLDSD